MPVLPRRSTAEEWIWSTSALTARLLARSSRSFKSVLASLAASTASRRLSSGSPEVSRYTARAPVAVARVRTAYESGSGEGYPGCTTLRAARERARTSRTVRSIWSAAAA
jgi:hypothetical protein